MAVYPSITPTPPTTYDARSPMGNYNSTPIIDIWNKTNK